MSAIPDVFPSCCGSDYLDCVLGGVAIQDVLNDNGVNVTKMIRVPLQQALYSVEELDGYLDEIQKLARSEYI